MFDADAAGYRKYKYSPEVSRLDWHSFESRRLRVAGLLPAHAGRALDLGCGSGTYLPLLASRCERLVAMDFSPAMLVEARKACGDLAACTYVVGDAMSVPLGDEEFDLVNCIGVIEYLPEAERCLSEIRRVLRPGGTAVVSVPNARSLWRLAECCYGPVLRRLRRLTGRRADQQGMDSFPRTLYTRRRIVGLVASAGLEVDRVRFYNYRLPLVGVWPALSLAVSRWLERCAPQWVAGWLGGGIVVRATKSAVSG
jgi:ubiquinone/menaquinone biosynthesis C-methylase UbiE